MSLGEDSIFFSLNVISSSPRKRWGWEQWEEKHSYPLISALGVGEWGVCTPVCVCVCVCVPARVLFMEEVLAIYWGFVCVCLCFSYLLSS